jgi:uncharacterized protein (TIGR03085 family)
MIGFARMERAALADALDSAGPQAPTLCEGWQCADLAAHLVVREARPDAAAGILISPLARWTERVQNAARDRTPYPDLVQTFRQGPPLWSPFRIGPVDAVANTTEYFIHHEDVRRAGPDWEPRVLEPDLEDELWRRLRSGARLMFRSVPVGVTLVRTARESDGPRQTVVAKAATPQMVTATGPVDELILFSSGRQAVARVELTGDEAAIAKLRSAKLGL